jgi:hypothetical protein
MGFVEKNLQLFFGCRISLEFPTKFSSWLFRSTARKSSAAPQKSYSFRLRPPFPAGILGA